MKDKIIEIKGEKNGPVSIILVGVHGDEMCGIKALEKLLPSLKIKRGRVLFAIGNPKAFKKNQRFIDTNLNRLFFKKNSNSLLNKKGGSYEFKRAQFLKKYLSRAEVLLDIHSSSIYDSKPFVICEKKAQRIARFLPVDIVVSGFDKVEPGGTDYYMNSIGKIGICLECGYKGSPQSINIAGKNILAFLIVRGHKDGNIVPRRQSHIKLYKKYYSKSNSFKLVKHFKDFDSIQKNQLIGIDGQDDVRAKKRSIILFASNAKNIGEESFLLGEKK